MDMSDDLKAFFLNPQSPKQRQYEALRAHVIDAVTVKNAARLYGFAPDTLQALLHDFRVGKLDFFPTRTTGPRQRRVTPHVQDTIRRMRQRELSVAQIAEQLAGEGIALGQSTVERVLKDAGFGKLRRRGANQRGLTTKNTLTPEPSQDLDLAQLKPFHAPCQVAGIFLFLPYIIESGILDVVDSLPLPRSGRIGKQQAFLSLLALKLMGGERLCHVRQYDHDRGFGIFAGLNVLPKPTYAGTYSCLVSSQLCLDLERQLVARLRAWRPASFSGATINLDFHCIPHFGEQSEMEKLWCGARNKALKAANTFFAQDARTHALLYANADVLRKEAAREILRFVDFLKGVQGGGETLVFDSHLTTYEVLGELAARHVKFITLRIRNKNLLEQTRALPEAQWQKVKLPIPKRKYQTFLAHESTVQLRGCPAPLRQIIMKEHGRNEPTFVVTNNQEMSVVEVLTVYARRWRIENKLAELVDFFNINALSSPIMIRIYFDLLLSVVASFLYHCLARDLPRFENHLAPDIFRRFIDMPGAVHYDGERFEVRLRKHAHTPILLGVKKLRQPVQVPWLGGRALSVRFTP
jgi:hypothetical protein